MKQHNKKIKLARKMMTPLEVKLGVSKFDSAQWQLRKQARLAKIIKQHHQEIGSMGGNKTLENKGKEYFKELNKKSVETRRLNKLNKQNEENNN